MVLSTTQSEETGEVREVREVRIPIVVMGQTGLSHGARLLYGVLFTLMRKGGDGAIDSAVIPLIDLRAPLTVSKRQLERYLNELEAAGFISVTLQQGGRPNIYTLLQGG